MSDLSDALSSWTRNQRAIVGLAADFADSTEWTTCGAVSAAHWIAGVADIEISTAREWIRVGRRLRELPSIAKAFNADRVSYSKIRTLTRLATPENEAQLLPIATSVSAGQLGRSLAAWMSRTSSVAALTRHQQAQRSVTWRTEPDGMVTPESFIRLLIHDSERRPINASSRQRHPSVRQRRVVKERDRVCVDCGTTTLLEFDHVPDFAITGHTIVDELQLRCAPCHRRRHASSGAA